MRWLFVFAGFSGMCSVMLGAFGAHILRGKLSEDMLRTYQTAVDYQIYHSLALMMACYLAYQWPESGFVRWSTYLFSAGIVIFSGSLYMLSLTGLKFFGPVTPVGGLVLIFAWLLLTIGIWENTQV